MDSMTSAPNRSPGSDDRSSHGAAMADRLLSRDAWVHERCAVTLHGAIPMIQRRLEPFGPLLLFLAGSTGGGEAVGWSGSNPFVLSDLDLGVVLSSRPTAEATDGLHRELRELSERIAGPEVTIGIYLREERRECLPTPGLVDLLARRFVIAGDESFFEGFPQVMEGEIEPWEAFRIVGNRSRELLAVRSGPVSGAVDRSAIEAQFLLAKLADGIGTAWLLLRREYRTDRQTRWNRLDQRDVPESIRSVSQAVRGFLAAPGPDTWPEVAGLSMVRAGLRDLFRSTRGTQWSGVVEPYEYDPLSWRNRYRTWRDHVSVHGGVPWLLRARFRGTPGTRHLGAAVLYWLTLPEGTDPDLAALRVGGVDRTDPSLAVAPAQDNDRTGRAAPDEGTPELSVAWSDVARLLGEPIRPGKGAKDRLRERIGIGEGAA